MQLQKSKAKIERNKRRRKKGIIIFPIILILLISGFIYYAYSARFQINKVNITGNKTIKTDEVETSVQNILSNKLWGFIPEKSKFLINKELIQSSLYSGFPSIKNIEIEISNNIISINILERDAVAIVCSLDSKCLFVDDNGFAFENAPQFDGYSFIRINTYEDNLNIGNSLIQANKLVDIKNTSDLFKSINIPIKYIQIQSDDKESLIGSNGTTFIINRHDTPDQIFNRLKALISSRPDVVNGKYEYIDLRIDSKIFIKSK